MIETILIAFIVSKIKGYNIKPLFKSWEIYPVIIMEVLYWIGQVMIWNEYYEVVKVLVFFKTIYLCSYIFLVYKYEVYISAIVGASCISLGGLLNDLAIRANGGFMPVYPTLSYITGYEKPEAFQVVNDIHILGGSTTSFKILTDFIDLGYSVLSIGDILIRVFVFLIIFNSIKKINLKAKEESLC